MEGRWAVAEGWDFLLLGQWKKTLLELSPLPLRE